MKYLHQFILTALIVLYTLPAFSSAINEVDFPIANNSLEKDASNPAAPVFFEQPYTFLQTLLPSTSKDVLDGLSTSATFKYVASSKPHQASPEQPTRIPEPNILVVFVIGLIGLILSRRNVKSHS